MFKKPKRNFQQRKRIVDSDDGNEKTDEEEEKKPELEIKPQTTNQPLTSRLCFQEDEESADEFKVKKSSFSKRVTKQLERERRKREEELRAKDKSLSEIQTKKQKDEKADLDIVWIPPKIIKPEDEDVEVIQIPDEDHFSDDSVEEEDSSSVSFRKVMERGVIPDATAIFNARKQRQRVRDMEDFIALNDRHKDKDEETEKVEHDADDDEEDEAIEFGVTTISRKDRVRQSMEQVKQVAEDDDASEESDDELTRWEQEQIRKGVGNSGERLMAEMEAERGGKPVTLAQSLKDTRLSTVPAHLLSKPEEPIPTSLIFERLKEALMMSREKVDHLERSLVNIGIEEEMAEDELATLKEKQEKIIQERQKLLETVDRDKL